ncbi:hypothetical protein GCM10009610_65870 [Pseudonocardia xinjiangensis]
MPATRVIAEAARTMPHTLRRVGTDDETLTELSVLAGYDDDLAGQSTRLTNRLRDALLHVHPALERLLGAPLDRGGVLNLLTAASNIRQGGPAQARDMQAAAEKAGNIPGILRPIWAMTGHVLLAAATELANGRRLPIEVRRAALHRWSGRSKRPRYGDSSRCSGPGGSPGA